MSFVCCCCCCLSTFDSRRHLCATLTFDPKAVNPQPRLGRTSGASAAFLGDPALISPQMFVALQFVASYKFSGPDVGPGRGPALRSATTFRACCATLQEKNALAADGGKSKFKAAEPAGCRLQTGFTPGVFNLDVSDLDSSSEKKRNFHSLALCL